jgi:hypothetical protein
MAPFVMPASLFSVPDKAGRFPLQGRFAAPGGPCPDAVGLSFIILRKPFVRILGKLLILGEKRQ